MEYLFGSIIYSIMLLVDFNDLEIDDSEFFFISILIIRKTTETYIATIAEFIVKVLIIFCEYFENCSECCSA